MLFNSKIDFLLLYKNYRGSKSINHTLSHTQNMVPFKKACFLTLLSST